MTAMTARMDTNIPDAPAHQPQSITSKRKYLPIPCTARPKIKTGILCATAQMRLPSSKKKIAARRMCLAVMTVRSWPTSRIRPHWVTVG
jgi:hypothetical protein